MGKCWYEILTPQYGFNNGKLQGTEGACGHHFFHSISYSYVIIAKRVTRKKNNFLMKFKLHTWCDMIVKCATRFHCAPTTSSPTVIILYLINVMNGTIQDRIWKVVEKSKTQRHTRQNPKEHIPPVSILLWWKIVVVCCFICL